MRNLLSFAVSLHKRQLKRALSWDILKNLRDNLGIITEKIRIMFGTVIDKFREKIRDWVGVVSRLKLNY